MTSITPDLFSKHSHSRSSTNSTTTQNSNLYSPSKTSKLNASKHKKPRISEISLDMHMSLDIEDNFEFPLKSIFPATYHFSKTKKKHRRVYSSPHDFVPSNFLFSNIRKRQINSIDRSVSPHLVDHKEELISEINDVPTFNSLRRNILQCQINVDLTESACKTEVKSNLEIGHQKAYFNDENKLPVLGSNPCTTYCEYCKVEVHTIVIIRNNSMIITNLMEFMNSLFGCCSNSNWMNKMRYHRCSNCGTVLGRSCI